MSQEELKPLPLGCISVCHNQSHAKLQNSVFCSSSICSTTSVYKKKSVRYLIAALPSLAELLQFDICRRELCQNLLSGLERPENSFIAVHSRIPIASQIASFTLRTSKTSSAMRRLSAPMRAVSEGSSMSSFIAAVSATGSLGGTRMPFSP